jgi:DUF4097 and DUF4098 domain-containing protein YvlB
MNMRYPALLFLFAAACSFPRHTASKVVEFTVPATALQRLECETHNGGITITGSPTADAVSVRAEMSVRGYSQEEADSNLHLLEVGSETTDGKLRLFGKYPRNELSNRSPSFAFTLTIPSRLAVELESHNGDLRVTDLAGALKSTTHNGDIQLKGQSPKVALETHNGSVIADFAGTGSLDGDVVTHNGNVVLGFPGDVDATVAASTHNGSLTGGTRLADAKVTRRQLNGRVGAGTGKLTVTTHNGDVTVR